MGGRGTVTHDICAMLTRRLYLDLGPCTLVQPPFKKEAGQLEEGSFSFFQHPLAWLCFCIGASVGVELRFIGQIWRKVKQAIRERANPQGSESLAEVSGKFVAKPAAAPIGLDCSHMSKADSPLFCAPLRGTIQEGRPFVLHPAVSFSAGEAKTISPIRI